MSTRTPAPPKRRTWPREVRAGLPLALHQRLALVRVLDGRPTAEFVRAALSVAVDDVLFRRCAFLRARPNAAIYRLGGGSVGAPVGATWGGERVLAFGRVPGLPEDLGHGEKASGDGYLCDLLPNGPEGVSMRRVVLHVEDVVPWRQDTAPA